MYKYGIRRDKRMIPSTNNRLLVAEDWKKIYQSFRNADFKSYDFETLRRSMIAYLRENYPEEFNDYVDSSEYIALIDLIAFIGQNLSFRIDLNARENFLETAERRESVLRLARLINYNPKRNVPASGFLKVTSIATSENVIDSNGINLANSIISWNDPSNPNWYQQFLSIINAAVSEPTAFGRPYASAVIGGIQTEQYKLNTRTADVPVYSFSKNIGGIQMEFELVSSTFAGKNQIYEETPLPGNQFGIIFKNDNKGSSSANTGFFVHFKQGVLSSSNFNVTTPVPNELIGVNVTNINDGDVWLWQLSADQKSHQTLWTKIPAITGNNVIYNSLNSSERNIYAVLSRENDQIDLSFADGSFGNLPNGSFKLYYRQSNGLSYAIKPEQMNSISVQLPYFSKTGQAHTLTLVLGLQYTVTNAVSAESNDDIKLKAPQAYYTQNRMVTAEDYNIAPLTIDADILKVKSINRTSSGISKYFELSDVSGKYSKTNIFATDGILYKAEREYNFEFSFTTRNEILSMTKNQLAPIMLSPGVRSFYLDKYETIDISSYNLTWNQSNVTTNQTKGYFSTSVGPAMIGNYSSSDLTFLKPGALVKFVPPGGHYFLPNGTITSTRGENTRTYFWSQIVNVIGDGSNQGLGNLADSTGPVILTGKVPGDSTLQNSAIAVEVIPKFQNVLSYGLESEIVNLSLSRRNFGLSFDASTRNWYIITDSNLNLVSPFSLIFQKDIANLNRDSSWAVSFEWTGKNYKVRYRLLDYVFESEKETAFFVDQTKKNYDFVTDTVVKDKITVLSINEAPVSTVSQVTAEPEFISLTVVSLSIDNTVEFSAIPGTLTSRFVAIHPNIRTGRSTFTIDGNKVTFDSSIVRPIPAGDIISFVSLDTVKFDAVEIKNLTSLEVDYNWQIDSAVIGLDGYIEPKKVLVSFYDANEDGQIDDPFMFKNIVEPESLNIQTGYRDKFVFFQQTTDGVSYAKVTEIVKSYPSEAEVPQIEKIEGQLYYFYNKDIDVVVRYIGDEFVVEPLIYAREGRDKLKFHYVHNSGQDRRIDPSKTNFIDVYLLTKTYDSEYRLWLSSGSGSAPLPATPQSLEENYSSSLESIKSISDEIVFHPAKYTVLFGSKATPQLQAVFKAVRNPLRSVSDTDIKTRIISAIEDFFKIEHWEFGQTFNFSELATYVMNIMTPDITNFVIVPKADATFGDLYQIVSQSDEIFVNGATVDDIKVIDSLTSAELKVISTTNS